MRHLGYLVRGLRLIGTIWGLMLLLAGILAWPVGLGIIFGWDKTATTAVATVWFVLIFAYFLGSAD